MLFLSRFWRVVLLVVVNFSGVDSLCWRLRIVDDFELLGKTEAGFVCCKNYLNK